MTTHCLRKAGGTWCMTQADQSLPNVVDLAEWLLADDACPSCAKSMPDLVTDLGPVVSRERAEAVRQVLMRDIAELVEALAWASGADDFQEGGKAEEGWRLGPARLLARMAETRGLRGSAVAFRQEPGRGRTPPFRRLVEPVVFEPGEPVGERLIAETDQVGKRHGL